MKQVFTALRKRELSYTSLSTNRRSLFLPWPTTYDSFATSAVIRLLLSEGVDMDAIELKRIDLLHAQGFIICSSAKS
jgi:hypothetical protein